MEQDEGFGLWIWSVVDVKEVAIGTQAADDGDGLLSPPALRRYSRRVGQLTDFIEPQGLRVSVDRVVHYAEAQTPPDRPHCFAYFITIHNDTDVAVTIKGRKWVVTNDRGEVTAVEGDGVVGEFPRIEPGGHFSYNSFHLNDTRRAVAQGSYIGVDDRGRKVLTRIPKFTMMLPAE